MILTDNNGAGGEQAAMNGPRKRLLIIGSTLGPYGGMEAFMITLAEAAANWPEFDVRLCFKLVKGHTQQPDLVSAAQAACRHTYFVQSSSVQLVRLISWAQILHVQNTPPDVIFTAKLLGKKIFLTIHNWRRKKVSVHNTLWFFAARLALRRWYNSKFVWDTWEPNKKSVNSDAFPTVSRLPVKYIPPESRRGFVFLGRWIQNKGIEEILKAYAKNNFNAEECPLVILGDGPLKPVVNRLVSELGLNKVITPGFVSPAVKENYMASARWLLATANTKEDLGLTPIEARNIGVPAIVSNDGGLPEAGGPAAFVVNPGDVDDLAACMKTAAEMTREEYASRSKLAKESLKGFLRPIDFYRTAYLSS